MKKLKVLLPVTFIITLVAFVIRTIVKGAGATAGLFSTVKN